ncbi:hypothetical protein QYE76_059517 [Lolium multiflorum]|uniref:Uncharacterized protein n=1 Tax=Lolium multiflorum TaxID=4521 RepID=A0AAD8S0J6_LOLMU|nr:hypothetical protein QYE76_059517 [Lolium multiflorum]
MPCEASEAMPNLIFTAARYPDLPEMCDLIHIFTDRYGACIEPFVCSEKLQNMSFTNEKMQVMDDIAGEFALFFSTKAIKRNISGVAQNKKDLLKKGSFNSVEVEASFSQWTQGIAQNTSRSLFEPEMIPEMVVPLLGPEVVAMVESMKGVNKTMALRYVMTKMFNRVFATVPEDVRCHEELFEKMSLLQQFQFIRPENLDMKPEYQN